MIGARCCPVRTSTWPQILDGPARTGADGRHRTGDGWHHPPADATELEAMGIKRVFTPADYELMDIMESIVEIPESAMNAGCRTG